MQKETARRVTFLNSIIFSLASIVCRYCTAQFCEGKILKEHNSRRRKKDADRCGDGTSERSSAWTGRRRRRFADAEIRSYRSHLRNSAKPTTG
jgi:hypothetical protein